MTTLPTVPLHGEIAAVLFGSAVQTGCLQLVVIAIAGHHLDRARPSMEQKGKTLNGSRQSL